MRLLSKTLLLAIFGLTSTSGFGQVTDIATIPLTYSLATQVKPNVMFILDDSGSMASRFMPEAVNDNNIDKSRCSNSNCNSTTTAGLEGNPPWYAYQFNTIYYNPQVRYLPAIDGSGNRMTSYGSPWTNVKVNAFVGSSTINLVSGYPEIVYCKNNSDNPTDATNCRRNGIDTGNPFVYNSTSTNGYPNGTSSGSFRYPITRNGGPFYYDMLPREHCSDVALTTCTLSATPTGNYVYPAPVRFCQNSTDANSNSAVTGSTSGKPRCQESWSTNHTYARYGKFSRVDITPSQSTYGGRPGRTDCAAYPVCTYAEEMTNFANWYAYYSTRMQMMKTAVGYAFLELDGRYRVGFITINPGSPVSTNKYAPIDTFSGAQRTAWYTKLYSISPSGNTPLREALSRVGRHYAGIKTGINSGMSQDPVQYSCQPNVAILSTDGYWNSSAGQKTDGSAMTNMDNVDAGFSTRASGAFDGNLGASWTLADVAMYYYASDLRAPGSTGALGTDVSENNVPTTTRDMNSGQHMLTFTLGLGLGGFMRYLPNYEAATFGDFYNIRTGNTGCSWQATGTVCNWPVPPNADADDPAKLDDLWHAAVNARGRFVSANDSTSLYDGLVTALSDLRVLVGSAAASATSSPNITTTDNAIYSSTYRTTRWDGELIAQRIDPATGNVAAAIEWSARDRLNAKTSASSDSRVIYTGQSGALIPFSWASMDTATRAYFTSKCSSLSQCAGLNSSDRATVDNGANLVNFVRGQRQYESLFREREYVLGDLVGSRPGFVRDPRRSYGDADVPSYFDFKALHASRRAMVYIGGNDGMLHAFDATTGDEVWAFVPRTVLPKLYKLAETAYATSHEFYVDGSPAIGDAYFGGQWRTVLIGGLNDGGRGYYALDITDPVSPVLLWEFCSDSTLCPRSDADLGLSFGNPVMTKRSSDGRWVALLTSGYNNVSPGDGRGYLYVLDLATGAVLNKVGTGVGSTTDPSGFARVSNWVRDPDTDNTTQYVYGGDLEGNLWRFDLDTSPPGVLRMATLKDSAGRVQPITARPELGQIESKHVVFVGTGRYLGSSDLQDPATLSPAGDWSYVSSVYAIKDTGLAIGSPRTSGTFRAQTVTSISTGRRGMTGTAVNWSTDGGWYVDFPSTGERVNLDLQLVLGTLVVTTNVPNNNACTAGGDSWIYQFNYKTGQAVSTASNGEVGVFRPGTLTVGNAIVRLYGLSMKIITTGASGVKETRGLNVGSGVLNPRRIGWREVQR
ncbi:MAG TPA: PilC/PilY family type IV pilus protein [Burkholderiaceae bacterium]|nr:PilC/PilY family type IV pilus protein [Burkholderiaceae bacterium]